MIFMTQTHQSKGVQRDMLKAWNVTQKGIHRRSCAEKFPNKHSSERLRKYTFDSCFNDQFVSRQLIYLNFKGRKLIKMMSSLLADINILFQFSKLYSLHLKSPILDVFKHLR